MNDSNEKSVNPEDTLVNKLAAPIIKQHKKTLRFTSRNREAWKRMNRPEKLSRMERGAVFINRLMERLGS